MKNNINFILNYFDEIIPDPVCELKYNKDYELVIAVMLSAQTTDKRVNIVTKVIFSKYPDLKTLKQAELDDIIVLVKQLGSFNKKSKAIIEIARILDENYDGVVPNKRKALESLPMVGRKSANVILSEIFNEPNIAVDTHVERVSKRLNLTKSKDNVLQVENKLKKLVPREKWSRFHHQMVLFGRYFCLARNPNCKECKLKEVCKYYQNIKKES